MSGNISGFYAYASSPDAIGQTIEEGVSAANNTAGLSVKTWKALDIAGHFISEEVLEGIDACDFLVADISVLNFNVTYVIGYAIGKKKRILITKNKSIREYSPTINEVGIFDTLGYKDYQNSNELSAFIKGANSKDPLNISSKINIKSPVYLCMANYQSRGN